MHKPIKTASAAWLALWAAGASAQDQASLDEALRTSPDIGAAEAEAEAAGAELRAARGAWLPQLRVEGEYGTLEETFETPVPIGPGGETSLTGTRDPGAALLVVEQVLFAGGRIGGGVRRAAGTRDAAGYEADAVRQDTVLAAVTAAGDLRAARARLSLRQLAQRTALERLGEAEARRANGLATVTDLDQARARSALAEAETAAALGALQMAVAGYERAFGTPPPATIPSPPRPEGLPLDPAAALSMVETQAPELLAARARGFAARGGVRESRAAQLPQVTVAAEAARITNERFGLQLGDAERYGVFVRGRWNLWDGGSAGARTSAARKLARAAELSLAATERLVRERAVGSLASLQAAEASLAARKRQTEAARTARDGVARELEIGRRTRLDLLDADRELAAAQVAVVEAERDVARASYALARAVGGL